MLVPAAGLVLLACGTAFYDKPGLTYTEWRRDDAECRRAAQGDDPGAAIDPATYRRCLRERGYRIPAE